MLKLPKLLIVFVATCNFLIIQIFVKLYCENRITMVEGQCVVMQTYVIFGSHRLISQSFMHPTLVMYRSCRVWLMWAATQELSHIVLLNPFFLSL